MQNGWVGIHYYKQFIKFSENAAGDLTGVFEFNIINP